MSRLRREPDATRAKIPIPKIPPVETIQLRPRDLYLIAVSLKSVGISPDSGHLAWAVVRHALGEDSPEWNALLEAYKNTDKAHFLSEIRGLSQDHIEKAIYSGVSFSHLSALLAAIKDVTGKEFKPALVPDGEYASAQRETLLAFIRECLNRGETVQIGVEGDLWRSGVWAIGRPETAKKESVFIEEIESPSPFQELAILWSWRQRSVPIGRAIIRDDGLYSVVLDGRAYTFGYPTKVGQKHLWLVRLSPDVKAHIEHLIMAYIHSSKMNSHHTHQGQRMVARPILQCRNRCLALA